MSSLALATITGDLYESHFDGELVLNIVDLFAKRCSHV